jgi:small subunit ribosomal protein S8
MTDPIADMLTRMRNAVLVKKAEVLLPFSKIKFAIAKILAREGFIVGTEKVEKAGEVQAKLRIVLKYKKGEPVLRGIKRVSTPGRRVYYSYRDIPRILPSLGMMIVSTSRGLMTNIEAKKEKLGGEIICEVN